MNPHFKTLYAFGMVFAAIALAAAFSIEPIYTASM